MLTQSHLQTTPEDISSYVLLPGDPARVDVIGRYLDQFRIVANNREFRIGIGLYKKRLITVCSTGIGCPSTVIAAEELINAGAKILIRVGTCGGAWRKDIPAGSIIIPTACVRDEGTTLEYIPPGFPAVADIDVISALRQSARDIKTNYYLGINRTHDAFYGSQASIQKWGAYLLDKRWQNIDTPILSSDMECSALFVIASLRRVKAGAVLAVNADPEPLRDRLQGAAQEIKTEKNNELSKDAIDQTIQIALKAICSLQ